MGARIALTAAALAAFPAARAAAQVCYSRSGYLSGSDICGTQNVGNAYDTHTASDSFFVPYSGTNYLVATMSNDLGVYDVGNPTSPGLLSQNHIPWDWGSINGEGTHGSYNNHLRTIAFTPGFGYGLAMLGSYGWDVFKLSRNASGFLGIGYKPASITTPYQSAALFTIGQEIWAAAQALDSAAIAAGDASIRLYKVGIVGNPAFTEALTPANIGTGSVLVPIGHAGDPLPDTQFALGLAGMRLFALYTSAGRIFLVARSSAYQVSTVAVVDVTTPTAPQVLASSSDATLASSSVAVDQDHGMIWAGDKSLARVYGYNIHPTLGTITGGPTVDYIAGAPSVGGATVPTIAGNLLVAVGSGHVGYVSLAGGTPTVLADGGPDFSNPTKVCLNAGYSDACSKATAFVVGGHHYACRSLSFDQDVVAVADSCMSTVPAPNFTVSGGSSAATCPPGSGTQADAGFPGDTFTIQDTSGGVWTTGTLDIQQNGVTIGTMGGQTFPMTITPRQSVPWTPPPSTAPGDFSVVVSITGGTPPSTTKVISLCNNPKATLTVTVAGTNCVNPAAGCTALLSDLVAMGVATTGTPSAAAGPIYSYLPPGSNVSSPGPTIAPPLAVGQYTLGVVVPYSFPAPNDAACGNTALFGTVDATVYHSCSVGTVTAGYGTASFQVEQPAGTVVPSGGSVNIAQAVTLKFLGRIASPYTPSFQWTLPSLSSPLTCTYTTAPYTGSTCTIAANALAAGPATAWGLTVNVCSAGGLGSPPAACTGLPVTTAAAPAITVTPVANTFSFTVNPTSANVGDAIQITLANVVGSFQNLTFNLGGTACDGSTQLVYNCVTPFGNQCQNGSKPPTFTYGPSERGKVDTITATGTLQNTGGTLTSPAQVSVSVSNSATSCPCPTVTTNVSGPTSALVGQQVQFTATASAPGYSISGYSWTFGDGASGSGDTMLHGYSGAGTYTVRVTATSSCGNTGTDSMAIVVGGGGGGNFTITPAPSNPGIGQSVTFTFSPKITVQGDAVTFNFGDGNSQTVTYSAICQIAGGCDKVTHAYTAAGAYTVTGSGAAGGASVSGSTPITVIDNCTASAAPTAAFSWAPAQPQVNQPVQFTDGSTGGPTSWSWSFGTGANGAALTPIVALAAGNMTITPSPSNPAVGASVKFTFSPGVSVSGDQVTFDFGDGNTASVQYNSILCNTVSPCASILHKYTSGGTFNVSATGVAGGYSVSGSTTVTVTGQAAGTLVVTPTPNPVAAGAVVTLTFSPALSQSGDALSFNFGDTGVQSISYPNCGATCNAVTHAYAAAGTYQVTASGTAGGASVTGGATVTVTSGGGGTSTVQNPVFTYATPGTYTVSFTATNCKGSSTLQQQITVLPSCTQTAAPTASFTWGPTGPLAGFPEQQQPYVGQAIVLTDASTNGPTSWHWYDFNELALNQTTTSSPFTVTWPANLPGGDKNVRMTATNCFGTSAEVLKVVHVYPDVRHVVADFSWAPDPINTGATITFTAVTGAADGDPDTFVWTFDDAKGTATGSPVTHTFSCAGNHRVTLTASRSNYPGATATVVKSLTVNGTLCGPESVMAVDNAKLNGLNGTSWRTDVRIFNPAASASSVWLQFLPVNADNTNPGQFQIGPYVLPPKSTKAFDDILSFPAAVGQTFTKTALRVTYQNDQNVAPMVIGRTYTPSPGGGTYGQFTPGISVYPGTAVTPVWLTGLRNNGLQDGFRTNYSFVNLLGAAYVGNINVTLYDVTGAAKKTVTLGLGPFGYLQDSVKNLFGPGYDTVGTFSLKLDIPPGADIQAYASVVDNQTGAPVLVPAAPPAASPIYLPAVAHTTGKNGTVWRSDMQLTNPDSAAHTWEITYRAKASDPVPPEVKNTITLGPQQSFLMADALGWIFNGALADATNTTGVLMIAPHDGTEAYPIVQARSFNQTANGTFGQNITPFTGDMGLSTTSPETRLVITGMSTTDTGFRTNFGFVNLSETSSVNFSVIFYDQSGSPLNPAGNDGKPVPLTFALGVGGWDQDQLENRFRNAFGTVLPANQTAISAEIFVTGGGPGTVYATVIDNLTGDPVFIPAQPAP